MSSTGKIIATSILTGGISAFMFGLFSYYFQKRLAEEQQNTQVARTLFERELMNNVEREEEFSSLLINCL